LGYNTAMNEFTAKKLGEVLAFATVSLETAKRAEIALKEAFGDDRLGEILEQNKQHIDIINNLAEENEVAEIVNKKLTGTGEKLRQMRDLYIGDEWGNPTELLEWSGFFEGAAIVHWDLVAGAGESLNNESLINLAKSALTLHREIFSHTEEKLNQYGQTKAK